MSKKIDDKTKELIKKLIEEKESGQKEWTLTGIAEAADVSIPTIRKVRANKTDEHHRKDEIPINFILTEWDEVRMPFVKLAEQRDRRKKEKTLYRRS